MKNESVHKIENIDKSIEQIKNSNLFSDRN